MAPPSAPRSGEDNQCPEAAPPSNTAPAAALAPWDSTHTLLPAAEQAESSMNEQGGGSAPTAPEATVCASSNERVDATYGSLDSRGGKLCKATTHE